MVHNNSSFSVKWQKYANWHLINILLLGVGIRLNSCPPSPPFVWTNQIGTDIVLLHHHDVKMFFFFLTYNLQTNYIYILEERKQHQGTPFSLVSKDWMRSTPTSKNWSATIVQVLYCVPLIRIWSQRKSLLMFSAVCHVFHYTFFCFTQCDVQKQLHLWPLTLICSQLLYHWAICIPSMTQYLAISLPE